MSLLERRPPVRSPALPLNEPKDVAPTSLDRTDGQTLAPRLGSARRINRAATPDVSPRSVVEQSSLAATADEPADTVEALLLSVGRGNQEAFVALQRRMAGLVRVNVCRVLCDASRSDEVTQETFAEVLEDAVHFDPHRDSAQTWLLTRAHQHAMDALPLLAGAGNTQTPELHQSSSALLP